MTHPILSWTILAVLRTASCNFARMSRGFLPRILQSWTRILQFGEVHGEPPLLILCIFLAKQSHVFFCTSNGIIASKGFIASRGRVFLGSCSSRSARAQEPLPLFRRLRLLQVHSSCCSLSFARIGIIVSTYILSN